MTKNAVKTLPWLCAALSMMLVPGLAGAQNPVTSTDSVASSNIAGDDFLWNQGDACGGGGAASQQFPDFGDAVIQAADDFVVPEDVEWNLDLAAALGTFSAGGPIVEVVVQIWSDDGGLPGDLLCAQAGVNEDLDPAMELTLTGDCAGPWGPGTYWLSMFAYMPFVPNGQWFWTANASANGFEFAFQDPAGLTGNPCTSWGSGTTTCGVNTGSQDLCFVLGGTESPLQTVTEIPTLGQVGLVVLLLSLLGAGFYRLRRR